MSQDPEEEKPAPAPTPASAPEAASEAAAPARKPWLRRYMAWPTLIAVGVIVYITFFGEKSMTQRMADQRVIDSLEVCLQQQLDSLAYYRDLNHRITTDPALMEQVVREQYNMKRQNEDVYVVE